MSRCPACGDTRLRFNPRPSHGWDEGDLYKCEGCGVEGESTDLIKEEEEK
jgi:predicted RNA-binding Zn-ribbon protein involved in translation (DUF1610 family)